jgi:hypothetical protein
MDELAGEFLAHATGHGFRLGLILQRCNNDGKPLLLTLVHGDNKGGSTMMIGFLSHPSTVSRARSGGRPMLRWGWVAAVWPPLARCRVRKLRGDF